MEPGQDEIRRTVILTEDDCVAANRLYARRVGLSRPTRTAAITLGLLVMVLGELLDPTVSGLVRAAAVGLLTTLSIIVIFWLYYFHGVPSSARRSWREACGPQHPTDYLMTPDTLSYEQVDCSARMAWSTLTRWSEDPHCLLLFNTKLTFYILPRRDFSDAEIARIEAWAAAAGVQRF